MKKFEHQIRQRTYIALPPERVFNAITSAREWDAFFTTGMEIDPQPGGKMIWSWKDWGPDFYTITVQGKVHRVEPPHYFEFEWGSDNPTVITMTLTEEFGGTVLSLVESGYRDTPQDRDMILECAAGWGEAVTLLKFYLEHGITYTPPVKA